MMTMDQIGKGLSDLYAEHSRKLWVQYTSGYDLGVQAAQNEVNEFQRNVKNFEAICHTLETSSDTLEKRKAQVLHNSFKKFHQSEKVQKVLEQIQALENSIMDLVNKSRPVLDGKETTSTEIGKILSQSPDRQLRQRAYECRLPLNQKLIDAGFIKLLDLRKELAAISGYKSFVDYKLEEDELNSEIFQTWLEDCKSRKAKFRTKANTIAQKHLGVEELAPWDYRYLNTKLCSYNQAEVDMTDFYKPIAKTFAKFGFDIEGINLTYDVFPRKNKSEWGYNFTIEIGKDSRILANVTKYFSSYNVLLHETAHGVHFMGLNSDEYALNSGVSGIVAEGFANYFGSLSYSKEFLDEVFPAETAAKAFASFQEVQNLSHFQNFRFIPEILFDQQLYFKDVRNADDIQSLHQSLSQDILGAGHYQATWSSTIHHTSHPIYLHNYFLGDVMCENMKDVFKKRNGGKTADQSPLEFGRLWKEQVLAPSAKYPFLDLYEKICEEKLSISSYLDNHCLA